MNVLVTGASGFLGKTLCPKLEQSGHRVVQLNSRNCDLTQCASVKNFQNESYDLIFHLAAWTQAGDFCLQHPGEQWLINQQINTNVLNWWSSHQPQAKLVSMGTSCAYDPAMELDEQNYLIGSPIESLYAYAMTKRMLHIGQAAVARQFGLKYLTVVPSTLYGPGYHLDGRQMHFIFDLIRKILRGRLLGEEVVLWGDGSQRREVVYIDDFVNILLKLTATYENTLVNIGSGEEFTIREFASRISEKVGFDAGSIKFDVNRHVGARSKCLSTRQLREIIPDLKLTPLDQGLSDTIAWFLEEKETILV